MTDSESIAVLYGRFQLRGEIGSIAPFGKGNINTTFLVKGGGKEYIFQKVNTGVFRDPLSVMENIGKVLRHIEKKTGPGEARLRFYTAEDGRNYSILDDSFWRVMNRIDAITIPADGDRETVFSTGEAIGRFHSLLADFDGKELRETIPDFHDTEKRFEALKNAVRTDANGRKKETGREIEELLSFEEDACAICRAQKSGMIPTRVAHNDTKTDNVLFDRKTKRPILLIDLDTVMPGTFCFDFGDGARSACNRAGEDADPEDVFFDLSLWEAFANGYLSQTGEILTREEKELLPSAAFCAAAELGARFLTDFLEGDVYFRTTYPGQNLKRARCCIALCNDLIEKEEQIKQIIKHCSKEQIVK